MILYTDQRKNLSVLDIPKLIDALMLCEGDCEWKHGSRAFCSFRNRLENILAERSPLGGLVCVRLYIKCGTEVA